MSSETLQYAVVALAVLAAGVYLAVRLARRLRRVTGPTATPCCGHCEDCPIAELEESRGIADCTCPEECPERRR